MKYGCSSFGYQGRARGGHGARAQDRVWSYDEKCVNFGAKLYGQHQDV